MASGWPTVSSMSFVSVGSVVALPSTNS